MKNYQQRFAIIFSILLILSNISFLQPLVGHAAALENAVTIMAIDENGDEVLPLTAISIEDGDTAFDVLEKAGEKGNIEIDFAEYDFGNMVTGIGGVTPASETFWWSFNVYGEGASVGASSYDVSNAEHILFSLTDEWEPTIEAKVSAIDGKGNDVIPETTVNLMAGSTAYDALYQASKANDVELEATVDEQWFTFINNIGNTGLGNGWWNVAIDDQNLEVGILAHRIQTGEHLQLSVQSFDDPVPNPDGETDDEQEEGSGEDEEVDEPHTPELPAITSKDIQENIADLTNYTIKGNYATAYGDEWFVFGLANTNQQIPISYSNDVKQKIQELKGEFRTVYDLERVIIGLSASGIDVTSVAGYNLIDILLNHKGMEKPLINAEVYGLLALDSGQYDVPNSVRNKLIDSILEKEITSGGWALYGNTASADITGMVLTALAPYQDQEKVTKAIERATKYLSQAQDTTGGYYAKDTGGDSSESVSQVIIGLTSVGTDPTSDQFTKQGGNLVQHLMNFKNKDGGFNHILSDDKSNGMATSQALLALTAYQKYLNNDGLVYQFTVKKDQVKPVKPSKPEIDKTKNNKPEVIVKPSAKINQAKKEMTVSLQSKDIETSKENGILVVEPAQAREQIELKVAIETDDIRELIQKYSELKVNKGDIAIQIPVEVLEQLIRDTDNKIVEVQFIKQDVPEALGSVYDLVITVDSKVINNFDGEITLTFQVDPNLVKDIHPDQIKAFYFNEETKKWEVIADSSYDASSGIVTAKTSHFSVFGVFKYDEKTNISVPTKTQLPSNDDNTGRLPDTATNMYNILGVGVLLFMSGGLLIIVYRKINQNA